MADTQEPHLSPDEIKTLRKRLGMTQKQFAEAMGVAFATVNRWENNQTVPSPTAMTKLLSLATSDSDGHSRESAHASVITATSGTTFPDELPLDFLGAPDKIAALVDGERLARSYLANPAFATETSRIDPLPHQRLAVYGHMLPQSRLRFLLADDPGAGKTIMSGLYIRECLIRRRVRRILIVPPAGLVGNWQRELHNLFGLEFNIVRGGMAKSQNPFSGPESDFIIVSIDTLSGDRVWGRLGEPDVEPYDLVIFDEAHKLTINQEQDGSIRATDRYQVAAALAGVRDLPERWSINWSATHILLLTATPHQGKSYPYFGLWRLLDPELFPTETAFNQFPEDARKHYYIRRVKEEMVDFAGRPIYPPRYCDTSSYDLTQGEISEQALYDQTTAYIENFYNHARILSRTAARFAMTIFQRRLASSTWALLCSLRNRLAKIERLISDIRSGQFDEDELIARSRKQAEKARDYLTDTTADDEDGEVQETEEDHALGAFVATNLAELIIEREEVEKLVALAEAVNAKGEESKFRKMMDLVTAPALKDEKVIIYTEHRDTLNFIVRKLEAMGYAGQVACIHGMMNYTERDAQVELFRKPHGEGQPGARFFIGTDAAAEGINLQFCWVLVNYDIPWNPARLEQRMGRIHRYGQLKDRVSILNLVSAKTREGKVIGTLLKKLEEIREQLGHDKVFDVIGRIFSNVSLAEYIQRAIISDDAAEREAMALSGLLTVEQIDAIEARERSIFKEGGDVARQLPALREQLSTETLRHILPGYVRRYMEKAIPMLGMEYQGDLDAHFRLQSKQPGAFDSIAPLIERQSRSLPLCIHRPSRADEAIFIHPGEPLFEHIRDLVKQRCAADGLRGGVFVDASASEPYLLHVAQLQVERQADPNYASLKRPAFIEERLIALRQDVRNTFSTVPVEIIMLFKPGTKFLNSTVGFLAQSKRFKSAAVEYLNDHLSTDIAREHQEQLAAVLPETEAHLRRAYGLMEAEYAAARARLNTQVKQGSAKAQPELQRVKTAQNQLHERRDTALQSLRREIELIAACDVEILATLLVQPSTDPEDLRRQDAEVEAIAMEIAKTYEQSLGAEVRDVSTRDRARAADLGDFPGFDLLSKHGDQLWGIEVKGRADTGDVELTENEWAKAANLRENYWLYVAFDCVTTRPRLIRVQDPFGKLVGKARGKLLLSASDLIRSASIQ